MCAATSTPSSCACPARRRPMNSSSSWPCPPAGASMPAWAAWQPPTSANGTVCASVASPGATMPARIRKIIVQTDEVHVEMGRDIQPPVRKALALAVIDNPCAGRYVENLDALAAIGEELGALLGQRCVQALGIAPEQAHSYGKAAIVGEAGELEHAAAVLHPKLGAALPSGPGTGAPILPSDPAGPGAQLWQGRHRRRGGRARTCCRRAAPQTGRGAAQRARQGGGHRAIEQEDRRPGNGHRRAAGPQGCRLCAQPFRRHRSARGRRAARQRDRGRDCRDRQRPAPATHRRPGCSRHPGARWAALNAASGQRPAPAPSALTTADHPCLAFLRSFPMPLRANPRPAMAAPLLATALAMTLATVPTPAQAQTRGVIKIGEINSYKAQPAFLEPYKKGMELALEEINAAGGLLGKKVQLIVRDDNANPGGGVRAAQELVAREKIDVLTGSFLSHIGLALADFAKQNKFFFLAGEPLTDKIVWRSGNRYTYRLRPSTYMQVSMMVPDALALKKKRWALVSPNYEYGQSAAATFKQLLRAAQPDVEFVAEQAPPLGKVDAGSVVQALADARPEALFNVLFGADLSKFVREGNTRGLFQGREVVSLLTPHTRPPYQARSSASPRLGSIVGYSAIRSLAEGLKKAGSVDAEKLVAAFKGLQVPTPFGRITYRPEDNQSTMGGYVGRTRNEGGKGVMVDYRYVDGAKVQPSADEVRKMRPKD